MFDYDFVAENNYSYLLKTKVFLQVISVSALFWFVTDVLAFNYIGQLVAVLMLVLVVFVGFHNFRKGVTLFLFFSFLSPYAPRNLVSIVTEFKDEVRIPYYSFTGSTIFGFSMSQWGIVFLGIIALIKLRVYKSDKIVSNRLSKFKFFTALMVLLMCFATLIDNLAYRDVFNIRDYISDHRFFVLAMFSIIVSRCCFQYVSNCKTWLVSLLLIIGVCSGFKTLLHLLFDIFTSQANFSFATQPYLFFPLVLALFFGNKNNKSGRSIIALLSLFIFLGAFSISRGDVLLFFIDVILFVILIFSQKGNLKNKVASVFLVFCTTMLMVVVVGQLLKSYNAHMYEFLMFKIQFFTTELWNNDFSGSASIRYYEFLNIYNDCVNYVYPLLIGKGFGGYFTFDAYDAPGLLSLSDFSTKQLQLMKFTRPHTFINFTLLKGGVAFMIYYIGLIFLSFIYGVRGCRSAANSNKLFYAYCSLFSVFAFNMYWLPRYIFVFFLMLGILISSSRDTASRQFRKLVIPNAFNL